MKRSNNPAIAPLTQPVNGAAIVPHERNTGARPRKRIRCLADLDGRTAASINARRLVAALAADLGGDLTTAEKELVKRAALLGAIVENYEVDWLENKPADLSTYGRLVDRQRRVLEALGLKRQPKDITPPPQQKGLQPELRAMIKRAREKHP